MALTFLYSTAIISFSYLFLSFFYENCFFRANLIFNVKKAKLGNFVSKILEKLLPSKSFVLVDKEIKVVSRDLTQSVQLLMLLGICALYLYSLSIQNFFIQKSPEQHIRWWRSFFLILNICVESFVITALSSRFAFSAISREGKAFWILQKAPIKIEQLFKSKFWVWYCFIYLLSALVFGFASWIYFRSFQVVALKVLGLLVINLGLVSLAIGMGGYFARFDWEHISQVATSFGNLVYMILAVLLVMFDVFMEFLFALTYREPASVVFILALIVVNFLIAKYSLLIGARKLAS